MEALEGVPTGSCNSSVDATPATPDRYDAATPVTDRCIIGDSFLTEAPATPEQEQAYVDEFLVRDPTTALTARQASATKLDALCRKARILRAASSGSYGDALRRPAAAGARAAQARRRGRPAARHASATMRIVQEQRAAALRRRRRRARRPRPCRRRRRRGVLRVAS